VTVVDVMVVRNSWQRGRKILKVLELCAGSILSE